MKGIKDYGVSKKIGKILSFIEITLQRKLLNKNKIHSIILDDDELSTSQKIEYEIAKRMLRELLMHKLSPAERSHIIKIFNESYGGIHIPERIKSSKSFKDLNESFDTHFEKITNEIKKNNVIIICGKGSLMKDVLVEGIMEKISSDQNERERTPYINISELNIEGFLGKFVHQKWVPGILT